VKPTSKPTVFIGSSSEGLEIATALKSALPPDLEVLLWTEDIFSLGEDTLTSLLKFVSVFDFGVLVLTGDDLVKSRSFFSSPAPRDNVILELGLFMGALGRRRAFPVVAPPKKGRLKLPSDLLGNTDLRLPATIHDDLAEAVKEPADKLAAAILERSKQSYLQLLPSTGLAVGYFKNFLVPVCSALADLDSIDVNGAPVDISADNFDFHVVLPTSLSCASPEGAKRFVKDKSLVQLSLQPPGNGRAYPLFVEATTSGGRLQLYDYPTTLAASHEAIKLALATGFLGETDHHQILDNKEIENFKRALLIMLKDDPKATEFTNNITFERL